MASDGYVKISKRGDWPVIYKRAGKRGTTFMVDTLNRIKDENTGLPKRLKTACKSHNEAKLLSEQYNIRLTNQGVGGFTLSKDDQADAERALRILNGTNLSLLEACKFAAEHHDVRGAKMTISELVKDFAAEKERIKATGETRGTRRRTLQDYRHRHGLLARDFGDLSLLEFDEVKHFNPWLKKQLSQGHLINTTKILFNYAVKQKYLKRNPIEQSLPKLAQKNPTILRDNEWRNLLLTALHTDAKEDILATATLGLYCGLRPESEIGRLDWSHINLENATVFIDSDKTKVMLGGEIDIPPAAIKLLKLCHRSKGKVHPKNFRRRWDRVREQAGVKDIWTNDVMRHTCGTMVYAKTKARADVRKILRHVNDSQLRYYVRVGLELSKSAEAFYNFTPPKSAEKELKLVAAG
jgi:integrase